MASYVITPKTGEFNLSPVLFRAGARDYFKSFLDFGQPGKFSPVPFFLCCRAIELGLKAKHLETKTQREIKRLYSHDLIKSYFDLDPAQQSLSTAELDVLAAANKIYVAKEFEYLNVFDAATAYKRFPDLDSLAALTKKIIDYDA